MGWESSQLPAFVFGKSIQIQQRIPPAQKFHGKLGTPGTSPGVIDRHSGKQDDQPFHVCISPGGGGGTPAGTLHEPQQLRNPPKKPVSE